MARVLSGRQANRDNGKQGSAVSGMPQATVSVAFEDRDGKAGTYVPLFSTGSAHGMQSGRKGMPVAD